MPDTGAPWFLPYPVLSDEADAPKYIGQLATASDAALDSLQASVPPATELIQRGRGTCVIASGAASGTINVTIPITYPTAPTVSLTVIGTSGYRIFTTGGPSTSNIPVGVYTASGSTVGSNTNVPFDWIAIGPRPA